MKTTLAASLRHPATQIYVPAADVPSACAPEAFDHSSHVASCNSPFHHICADLPRTRLHVFSLTSISNMSQPRSFAQQAPLVWVPPSHPGQNMEAHLSNKARTKGGQVASGCERRGPRSSPEECPSFCLCDN